jgi:formate transporter
MFSIPNFIVTQNLDYSIILCAEIKEKGYKTMDVRRDTTDELRPDCRSGAEVMEKAMSVAVGKAAMSPARCFVSAIMAGMFIGSGALFMLFVKSDSSLSFAPSQVLGGICFSVGLICVVVAGAELFTGNNLMVCAKQCDRIAWNDMWKNWVLVWVGNFVGSLLLVCIVFFANSAAMNGGNVGNAMINVACAKIDLPWMTIFFRGILCNFLVCLAVWMSFAGKTVIDKIFTSILPVMAFVTCGFEHCVANMFFLPMALVMKLSGFSYTGYANIDVLNVSGALYNISAATIGNIVGGAIFVGLVYSFIHYKKVKNDR